MVVAEEPPTVRELAKATEVSVVAVEEGLTALEAACRERGIRVQRVGKTVKLSTAPEATRYVERFLGIDRPRRLSRAALETLAIIAYRQPVAKSAIEAVRGVGCDGSLQTLRDRELVEPVGQTEGPGQAYLYGTTARFSIISGCSDWTNSHHFAMAGMGRNKRCWHWANRRQRSAPALWQSGEREAQRRAWR